MPLPYADPMRPTTAVVRTVTKIFQTSFGQSFIKNVAAKTDPWLSRISNETRIRGARLRRKRLSSVDTSPSSD